MKPRTALDGIDPADFSSYRRTLEEMRPDLLDVTYHNNEAIEPVRDSALAAEDCGKLPRMEYTK